MNKAVQVTYFLLRVVTGLLFFQVGAMKIFGWFGGMPGGGGTPPLMSQIGIGGVLEVVGGIAIMLGLLTRPVAFILSGEMAVAYWQFHAPNATWPVQNQGQPAVLFCFIFLYMAAQGSCEKIRLGVYTQSGRDAVLRVRVGFSVSDAQQRVPTVEFFHSFRVPGSGASMS